MKRQDIIKVFAGSMVVLFSVLSLYNKYFIIGAIFVGLNLFQYGFSKFCPLEIFLRKFRIGN